MKLIFFNHASIKCNPWDLEERDQPRVSLNRLSLPNTGAYGRSDTLQIDLLLPFEIYDGRNERKMPVIILPCVKRHGASSPLWVSGLRCLKCRLCWFSVIRAIISWECYETLRLKIHHKIAKAGLRRMKMRRERVLDLNLRGNSWVFVTGVFEQVIYPLWICVSQL